MQGWRRDKILGGHARTKATDIAIYNQSDQPVVANRPGRMPGAWQMLLRACSCARNLLVRTCERRARMMGIMEEDCGLD